MTTTPPRERGRPALPKDKQKAKINITIDADLLELLSSNRSKHINKILRKELIAMKSYRYTPIALDDLTSTDLKQEAAPYSIGNAQAAQIFIFKANGIGTEAEAAEALYLPDEGRLGIAWGADATWADVKDFESGIEMWLNDGEAWEAAN